MVYRIMNYIIIITLYNYELRNRIPATFYYLCKRVPATSPRTRAARIPGPGDPRPDNLFVSTAFI